MNLYNTIIVRLIYGCEMFVNFSKSICELGHFQNPT